MHKRKFLLFSLACLVFLEVKCESEADKRFQQFHRGYEREMMAKSRSQIRRDASGKQNPNLVTRLVPYADANGTYTGYLAYQKDTASNKPLVVVVHDWNGRDEFENGKAEALAELGYVGFALDLYGKNASSPEEIRALMRPFRENRLFLLQQLQLAIDEAKKVDVVDKTKIGAIGFCFGGMGVLDMARAGLDLKGVASFHGSLGAPPQQQDGPVKAKILVLHGHDDPGIPPATVQAFEEEMTKRKADWQVHVYSNTVHSFTEPKANSTRSKYNALSDKRSWLAMKNFFQEVFA